MKADPQSVFIAHPYSHFSRSALARQLFGALLGCLLMGALAVPNGANAQSPEASGLDELKQKGDTALDEGRLGDAITDFKSALKLDASSPAIHNQLGLCYSRQNSLPEAAAEFKAAVDLDPKFLPSLNNLGTVYYRQGNYDQAIAIYSKALQLRNGADAELNTNLGSVYRDRATFVAGPKRDADFKAAIEHYQKALQDDPQYPQAHNNLGLCYFRLRRFDDAEKEIQKAISAKHDYSAAYYNLGLIEQATYHTAEAHEAFQNSLRYETVPAYAESTRQRLRELGQPVSTDHFSRGFDLLSQRKWQEAEAEFREATNAGSGVKTAIAWNNLGYVLAKQSRYRDAIAAYKKASHLLPGKFPASLYNLGQVLRTTGDLSGAEACFKRALAEASGTHALAHNGLGLVLKQKGDLKGAQAQYKLAILQSGDTLPVVHYNLGILYEREKDKKSAAIEEFKRYLEQSPDGWNAPAARSKLAQLNN